MARHDRFAYRNLPLLLLRAREALMQEHRPTLREHGLSDQQWRVLRVLRANADGVETGRLAEQAYILGPSLTGMLARMERAGLVTRERSDEDARRMLVRATARGLALVEDLTGVIQVRYENLAESLGTARLQTLYALLDDLIALPRQAEAANAESKAEA